jgi:hypothetical protein
MSTTEDENADEPESDEPDADEAFEGVGEAPEDEDVGEDQGDAGPEGLKEGEDDASS